MRVLIVLCAMVVASYAKPGYLAGGIAALAAPAVIAPQPVQDTPEVAAAKAAHAAAVAAATATANAVIAPEPAPAPVAADSDAVPASTARLVAPAPGIIVAAPGIAPLSIVPSRAFAYSSVAAAPAIGYSTIVGPAIGYAGIVADAVPAGLVLTPNGVPVDTPAVQAARAADVAAHLQAKGLILG